MSSAQTAQHHLPTMNATTHFASGQNHDRLHHHTHHGEMPLPTPMDDIPTPPGGDVVEITAVQKMLSATSGSLLTGLLVTPLDVVRVRWQSQGVTPQPSSAASAASAASSSASSAATEFHKLAMPKNPDAFRPSNLGVTACCREVFFMNNNSEVCLAGAGRIGSGTIGGGGGGAGVECAVEEMQARTFNSTIDGLRKIARNEGFTTLWRGLSPTLIMAIPANIIYFTGYEWLRLDPKSPIQRTFRDEHAPLVAGIAARTIAATVVGPIELFRTRLQASSGSTTGSHLKDTFSGIRDMVNQHGYRSLWKGLTLTLWRDVPFSGMYWLGYETIRGRLTDIRERNRGRTLDLEGDTRLRARGQARRRSQSRENHTDTFTDSFVAGALSGAFASVATMPFDVGKTRTQVYRDSTTTAAGGGAKTAAPEERTMVRLLWHIFKTEGVQGLFKGWIPRTLKVAPACAIMISSYEVGKRVFRGMNERALIEAQQQQQTRRDTQD